MNVTVLYKDFDAIVTAYQHSCPQDMWINYITVSNQGDTVKLELKY